jgi:hypothetical protein
MTKFLEALAGKLAERWLTLLLLPGALYLAAVTVAVELGHRRWYDLSLLRDSLTRIATDPVTNSPGAVVLGLAGLLAAATAFGIAAQALGTSVWRWWLIQAHGPVSLWLTARRAARWDRAHREFQDALLVAGQAQLDGTPNAPELVRAAEHRNAVLTRIAPVRPQRPFWLGDRIAAVDRRVLERYQLDLASAWPRLWLVMPDATRAELGTAQITVSNIARLSGWAVCYLALGMIWWPAAVIGAITVVTAWRRVRTAGDTLAELVESTVDIHGRALADSLGIPCPGPLTVDVGAEITTLLRKGS